MIGSALRYAKSLHSYNPIPYGCVLYLPFWALSGPKFKSVDPFRHECTVTGALLKAQGRWYDGDDDKIAVAHHAAFAFTTEVFTVSMWLNTDSVAANRGIFGKGTGADGYWAQIRTDGAVWFSNDVGDAGDKETKSTAGDIVINTWYYLTIFKNGNAVTMNKNASGLTMATSASHGNIGASTSALNVGAHTLGGSGHSNLIGEFYIWNRKLSDAEDTHVFNQTKGRYL